MQVEVYWNFTKKKFSIRREGHVVAHADRILMKGATFHVSEAGRQRVLREKHKNVHAKVKGELLAFDGKRTTRAILRDPACPPKPIRKGSMEAEFYHHIENRGSDVFYNPYKHNCFVSLRFGENLKVGTANFVAMNAYSGHAKLRATEIAS